MVEVEVVVVEVKVVAAAGGGARVEWVDRKLLGQAALASVRLAGTSNPTRLANPATKPSVPNAGPR